MCINVYSTSGEVEGGEGLRYVKPVTTTYYVEDHYLPSLSMGEHANITGKMSCFIRFDITELNSTSKVIPGWWFQPI